MPGGFSSSCAPLCARCARASSVHCIKALARSRALQKRSVKLWVRQDSGEQGTLTQSGSGTTRTSSCARGGSTRSPRAWASSGNGVTRARCSKHFTYRGGRRNARIVHQISTARRKVLCGAGRCYLQAIYACDGARQRAGPGRDAEERIVRTRPRVRNLRDFLSEMRISDCLLGFQKSHGFCVLRCS